MFGLFKRDPNSNRELKKKVVDLETEIDERDYKIAELRATIEVLKPGAEQWAMVPDGAHILTEKLLDVRLAKNMPNLAPPFRKVVISAITTNTAGR